LSLPEVVESTEANLYAKELELMIDLAIEQMPLQRTF
jgi:hypothetical protein